MAFSQLTKEEWLTTAEDTLESAVVFEDESSEKCGHALRLVPLMDYLESSGSKKTMCPICQVPFAFVCDGTVTATNESSSSSKENTTSVVAFKYRSHLYKLSLRRASNAGLPFPFAYCIWMWQSMLHFMGENTSITAQERIAHVLQMDLEGHMKILHKGKILYPNAQESPHVISEQLLEVCAKGGKPLVIGTRMTDRERNIALVKWMMKLYLSVVKVCLAKTYSTVHGLLSPFLPGQAIDRPHQA